jgi:hypothetical protein
LSKQYCEVFENPQRASRIAVLARSKKQEAMASLSNLSKFLGIYEYWKQIIRNNGLKWEKYSALDAIINILNSNLNDAQQWLKMVLQKLPREYGAVLVLNTLSGLRPAEACNSAALITRLNKENKLSTYLDSDLMMLQHFRFKDLFLRRNKNAYISFVSQELLETLLEAKPEITYSALRHKLNRLGFVSQANYLRKLHATLLRNNLPQELIDILQGRVSQSVFLRFYYKPFLQEIRAKALQSVNPLEKELLALLS